MSNPVILPALKGGEVLTRTGEPVISPLIPFNPSSNPIRWMDPVVLTSGLLNVGTAASAALRGFAAIPSNPSTGQIPQIPSMPQQLDGSGRSLLTVYEASLDNFFVACIKSSVATAITQVGTVCDLAAALLSPTPVLTTAGTAGATTRNYQVTAKNWLGESLPLSVTALTTGNATLSTTNYDIVTIPKVVDAITFVIYVAGIQVAEVAANPNGTTVYNNVGVAGTGAVVPTTNQSGWVVDPNTSSTNVIKIVELDSRDALGTLGGRVVFQIPLGKSQFLT